MHFLTFWVPNCKFLLEVFKLMYDIAIAVSYPHLETETTLLSMIIGDISTFPLYLYVYLPILFICFPDIEFCILLCFNIAWYQEHLLEFAECTEEEEFRKK
jgi:hypothetical protein